MSENQKLFALLIDGDNVNSKKIQEILDRVQTKGKILIKRVYNNKASMDHWEPVIGKHSLRPIWVVNNTKGKNSADIELVVDAMSLLYDRPDLDGFCIISSDSDFTALVKHIQTRNKYVLGIGNANTPEPFRNACTEFIALEEFVSSRPPVLKPIIIKPVSPPSPAPANNTISDSNLLKLFMAAYKKLAKNDIANTENDWIQLINVKAEMMVLKPDFQPNMKVLVERLKNLAKSSARVFEIREHIESKTLFHFVRLIKDSEIDKFRQAYENAAEEQKLGDKQGWVLLSRIASTLKKLFPKYNFLTYKGVKSSQLKKVVEKMAKDYPTVLEVKSNKLEVYIRMKK